MVGGEGAGVEACAGAGRKEDMVWGEVGECATVEEEEGQEDMALKREREGATEYVC